MEFRTEYQSEANKALISYDKNLFCIGSCFAENMRLKLWQHGFNTAESNFGIAFNPIVILKQLEAIIGQDDVQIADSILSRGNQFLSWMHHSRFTATERESFQFSLVDQNKTACDKLLKTDVLIITWGSAFCYYHQGLDKLVANCHKMPSNLFEKKFSAIDETVKLYEVFFSKLKALNPHVEVLLTVSPVRYMRDGFIGNSRSKSSLIQSALMLSEEYKYVHYFPSYEIMMDDLRDYRFVKSDLVHPSDFAVDYIWDKFKREFISPTDYTIMDEINRFGLKCKHKPLNPRSQASIEFEQHLLESINLMKVKYPKLDLSYLG